MIFLSGTISYSVFMVLRREYVSTEIIGLVSFPDDNFNYVVICMILANMIVSVFIEFVIIRNLSRYWIKRKIKQQYKKIEDKRNPLTLNQIHQAITRVMPS